MIRIGPGVPGRRRIPAWAEFAAHVGQMVLLMLLVYVALAPDPPRSTYGPGTRIVNKPN